jgi:hypothetical protein
MAWSIRPRLSPPVTKLVFTAVEGGSAKAQTFDRVPCRGRGDRRGLDAHLGQGVAAPLSACLDDPGFPAPISARLFPAEAGSARA